MTTAPPGSSAVAWLAAATASLPMGAIPAFWGFLWLLGSNGYFDGRGTILLFGNAALALACLCGGIAASALLARRFHRRGRSRAFSAGLGVCAATVALVVVGVPFTLVMS